MGVTKLVLGSIIVLVVAIACTVDNELTTVNAALSCNPTADQLDDFDNSGAAAVLSTNCVSCHDGSFGPPFLVRNATSTEDRTANLCAAYRRGQLSSTVVIFNYPQTAEHPVQFSASTLQDLGTWISNFTVD